jgi:hypothetical protein
VFSTRDNVQALAKKKLEESEKVWIEPLDNGSVLAHYLANGKGGEEAAKRTIKFEASLRVLLALRQEMCQLTQPWCRWCSSVSVSWT